MSVKFHDSTIAGFSDADLKVSKSGDTMTGSLHINNPSDDWTNPPGFFMKNKGNHNAGFKLTNGGSNIDFGWDYEDRAGAGFALRSVDPQYVSSTDMGQFHLYARDGTNTATLKGAPDGTLTWQDQNIITDETIMKKHYHTEGTAQTFSYEFYIGSQFLVLVNRISSSGPAGLWFGVAWDSEGSILIPVYTTGSGASVSLASRTLSISLPVWCHATVLEFKQ